MSIKKYNHINTKDIKLYIVDDEEYYLNLIKVNLNNIGYNDVNIFTSGEECLIEIEKNKPTCVILDFLIKDGMNGDGILKYIRTNYPKIDVIILSGQEDVTVATDIMKNGAYDYIVKDKMTFFNLNNSLDSILDKNNYEKDIKKGKSKYIFLIILVWVIGLIGLSSIFFHFFKN